MIAYYALKLDLELRYTIGWCEDALSRIIDSLNLAGEESKRGAHTEKTISIIFVSRYTPEELMYRLKPVISELNAIDNAWCGECPRRFTGLHGAFDQATIAVQDAIRRAEFLTESKNVGHLNSRKTGV
jgi:hypothetical protein